LKGSLIVFPLSNPFGFQFGDYISPHDVLNLVSAYPGSSDGSVTSRFANFIWENASKKADLVIDLHENVKPCLQFVLVGVTGDSNVEKRTLGLAESFGLSIARPSRGPHRLPGMKVGDLEYYELCLQNGVPSFMPELESSTDIVFSEEYKGVRVAVRGVLNCLKKLGMISGSIDAQSETKVLPGRFVFHETIPCNRGGIVNRLAEVGVKLSKGTPVANVMDPYGEVLETVVMPVDGYIWGWNLGAPPFYQWGVQSGDGVAYVYVNQ
jgi:predicted deacylase